MLSRVQISPPETKATHCNFSTSSYPLLARLPALKLQLFRLRLLAPSLLPAKTRRRQRRETSRAVPSLSKRGGRHPRPFSPPQPPPRRRFLPSLKEESGGGGKLTTTRDRSLLKTFPPGSHGVRPNGATTRKRRDAFLLGELTGRSFCGTSGGGGDERHGSRR